MAVFKGPLLCTGILWARPRALLTGTVGTRCLVGRDVSEAGTCAVRAQRATSAASTPGTSCSLRCPTMAPQESGRLGHKNHIHAAPSHAAQSRAQHNQGHRTIGIQ